MIRRRSLAIALCYLILIPVVKLIADTFDQSPRDILNVRVYQDGSFVFQFSPPITAAGCGFNDHGQVLPTAPAYKLLPSLALAAFTSHRQVELIYNGCTGGTGTGNVVVTGLTVLQQ